MIEREQLQVKLSKFKHEAYIFTPDELVEHENYIRNFTFTSSDTWELAYSDEKDVYVMYRI